ncbi:hypothetical protein DOU50_06325 [Enterobacter sp. C6]|nr:hypothetical protein DOU50_06325 [Enterobacter sp. C6]
MVPNYSGEPENRTLISTKIATINSTILIPNNTKFVFLIPLLIKPTTKSFERLLYFTTVNAIKYTHNLTTSQPHNLTTSQPHNLTTSQPHNLHDG